MKLCRREIPGYIASYEHELCDMFTRKASLPVHLPHNSSQCPKETTIRISSGTPLIGVVAFIRRSSRSSGPTHRVTCQRMPGYRIPSRDNGGHPSIPYFKDLNNETESHPGNSAPFMRYLILYTGEISLHPGGLLPEEVFQTSQARDPPHPHRHIAAE